MCYDWRGSLSKLGYISTNLNNEMILHPTIVSYVLLGPSGVLSKILYENLHSQNKSPNKNA